MKRTDISIQIYENLYETDNSLEKCRLPKLTPLQLEIWDRPIIIEKIKLLKSNPIKKHWRILPHLEGPDSPKAL